MSMTEHHMTEHEETTHVHLAHVMPLKVLIGIWLVLVVLTVLTVAVTYVDLGALNIWMALGIATVKAALVALYFMHLRYDSPFNALILICALLFVMLFISLSLHDSIAYQQYMDPPEGTSVFR